MIRSSMIAIAVLTLVAMPAAAKRIARPWSPLEKVARAEVVVVGKVTAIEKAPVDAVRFIGDPEKVPHRVAVIKIDRALVGGTGITHVKVGFLPPPPVDPAARPGRGGRGLPQVDLKAQDEGVYFLTRHPGGEFYTITPMMAPIDSRTENYKSQMERVVRVAAALADSLKALRAEKPADRYLAAAALISRYRSFPEDGRETTIEKAPAEESKLILQALADADWKQMDENDPGAMQLFFQLGLEETSGFTPPQAQPGTDFASAMKGAFTTWLAGPGKDYQIQKIVPKKR